MSASMAAALGRPPHATPARLTSPSDSGETLGSATYARRVPAGSKRDRTLALGALALGGLLATAGILVGRHRAPIGVTVGQWACLD